MIHKVRYQVFVSSTYDDLRLERQQVTQAILEMEHFPSGMELFPASDDSQWELIKRVISECDFYIVIVGARYGTLGPSGISYTEMEYRYAEEIGLPILGFVRRNTEDVPAKFSETDAENKRKLEEFRKYVKNRTCRLFDEPAELGMAVMKALMQESRIRPRLGWVRADEARSEIDVAREERLHQELKIANDTIKKLERELRDRVVSSDEISYEELSKNDDIFEFHVSFTDNGRRAHETVGITWNEIFSIIGPPLYGYIIRKHRQPGLSEKSVYPFESDLVELIRSRLSGRAGNRKIQLIGAEIDRCIFQFKELGLIQYAETDDKNGDVFRGITLTEEEERHLTLISTQKKTSK